ncbi:MAG TPA: hypothetical protein VMT55_02475, partial [Candidatus Sulfotelmatobacter sp.]|nr:hypothetical protein [Candidatus Sulfotelmatobacter sp.]
SKRMESEIKIRAEKLKIDLVDKNIWARVFHRFICYEMDASAGACLLTALHSLLFESPMPVPRLGLHQRYEAGVRSLGDILFIYDPAVVSDVVRGQTEPALISIVADRATIDLPGVVELLKSESADLNFARRLLAQLQGNQGEKFPGYEHAYDDLVFALPPVLYGQITPQPIDLHSV